MTGAINLLPWRLWQRRRRISQGLLLLVLGTGLVWGLCGLAWLQARQGLDRLQLQVDAVQRESEQLASSGLLKRHASAWQRDFQLQLWQKQKERFPRLLHGLADLVPGGVRITGVELRGDGMTLRGEAATDKAVESYLQQLRGSDWLQQPQVTALQARSDQESAQLPYVFTLRGQRLDLEAIAQATTAAAESEQTEADK